MLRTEAGSGTALGLALGLAFPWTWESAAAPNSCSLASSPWHPEPACLIPTIQASNSQLSALSRPAPLLSPHSWVGTARSGKRWREPGRRPAGAELRSGGDCDPEKYHAGAPGRVRTRARQRKVVSVRVSVSMGVFVCLCFCTCVYESGGVWVGYIRGYGPGVPQNQVLQVAS